MTNDFFSQHGAIVAWGYTDNVQATSFAHYRDWIKGSHHAGMRYLADHRMGMRESLQNFWPKASSALVFLFSYASCKKWLNSNYPNLGIGSFTLGFGGDDYHVKIRDVLNAIAGKIQEQDSEIEYKLCVDTDPLLERDLAYRAGLGFFGRSSMFIHPEFGSYTIIGSILLSKQLDIPQKEPIQNGCNDCRNCVENCPTSAILENGTIDGRRCISTFTVEKRQPELPPVGYEKSNYFFGCDMCMDVCPFNIKALDKLPATFEETTKIHDLIKFFSSPYLQTALTNFSDQGFAQQFKGTSFERIGKKGLLKNL